MQGALGKSSEEILDGYSLGNPFILLKLEVSSLYVFAGYILETKKPAFFPLCRTRIPSN